MHASDPLLPPLVSREEARLAGMSDRQVTRRVRRGEWAVARRGLLVPAPCGATARDPVDIDVVAAVRSTRREVAVAVAHAARVWRLPRPLDGWGRPMLLAVDGPTRNQDDLCIRVAPLADGDLVQLPDGLVVTSPLRTVADCLRHLRPPDATATVDAALRAGLVTRDALVARLLLMKGWPGIVQARRLADLADPRRESTLESWSAVAFATNDVPMPTAQVEIVDVDGPVGRVDFRWPCGLVGESDGREKYRLAAAQQGGADAAALAAVLDAERERERRLRATGADVVRWGAKDVLGRERAADLAEELRRRIAEQERRTVIGYARPAPLMLVPGTGLRLFEASKRYLPRAWAGAVRDIS